MLMQMVDSKCYCFQYLEKLPLQLIQNILKMLNADGEYYCYQINI